MYQDTSPEITYDLIKRFLTLGCTTTQALTMAKYCIDTKKPVVVRTDGVKDTYISDELIDDLLIQFIIDPYSFDDDDIDIDFY